MRWKSSPAHLTQERPLRHPGSLTARLARMGSGVDVEVLESRVRLASWEELQGLGLSRRGLRVFVRCVCVRRGGEIAVLAKSVTTLAGVTHPWRGLKRLGNRPLATLLWSDPRIRRGGFQYLRWGKDHPLSQQVGLSVALPVRRSCFWLKGYPLLVTEAFVGLPWPVVQEHQKRHWSVRRGR